MPLFGVTAIAGTTTPSDNPPTSLGAPGTYGAGSRAAVPIQGTLVGSVTTVDGRSDNVADTAFATALNAKNPEATGATAGTPGAWLPANCIRPARIADAPPPTVATAWTAGQYILLADASEINWNGTAWVAGRHA